MPLGEATAGAGVTPIGSSCDGFPRLSTKARLTVMCREHRGGQDKRVLTPIFAVQGVSYGKDTAGAGAAGEPRKRAVFGRGGIGGRWVSQVGDVG